MDVDRTSTPGMLCLGAAIAQRGKTAWRLAAPGILHVDDCWEYRCGRCLMALGYPSSRAWLVSRRGCCRGAGPGFLSWSSQGVDVRNDGGPSDRPGHTTQYGRGPRGTGLQRLVKPLVQTRCREAWRAVPGIRETIDLREEIGDEEDWCTL